MAQANGDPDSAKPSAITTKTENGSSLLHGSLDSTVSPAWDNSLEASCAHGSLIVSAVAGP